jgi:hypothetical protein
MKEGRRFWIAFAVWAVSVTVILVGSLRPSTPQKPDSYRALNIAPPSR